MRDAALDEALNTMYVAISGPRGRREWVRNGECFAEDARLTIVHSDGGERLIEVLSVPEYRNSRDAFFERNDFFESEICRFVEIRGSVAHVFSEFACRSAPDAAPFATGTNSIQLVHARGRWWIVSILWESTSLAASLRSSNARVLG